MDSDYEQLTGLLSVRKPTLHENTKSNSSRSEKNPLDNQENVKIIK